MITEARRRQYLHEVVEAWDAEFDPEVGVLLRAGAEGRRAQGQATDGACAREESMHYAFALLELAERARQGRAEAIMSRVIDLPSPPETEDVALALMLIWHRHRRRLPKILADKIASAIVGAADRIKNIDTVYRASAGPGAMINDLFVLLSAAKITDSDDWMARALDRLRELQKAFGSTAPFPVKVGSDDVATGLAGLHAISSHISDERVSESVALLSSRFWQEVSLPFREADAPTRIVRADMPALLVEMASRGASRGRTGGGRAAYAALYACVMKAPTEAVRI